MASNLPEVIKSKEIVEQLNIPLDVPVLESPKASVIIEKQKPEVLHEQQGLIIKKNPLNKFCVVSLYYYADPDKRGPEWEEEARYGMSDAQFRKEYLIDYTALYGEKVFEEFVKHRDKIIVKQPYPEVPPDISCWGGFDYGPHNPSSFHVYTLIDDVMYVLWELYEPCRNIPEFAKKMIECPYWSQIKYIAADPSMWATNQQLKEGNVTSLYNMFVDAGIGCLTSGLRDEQAWVAKMRYYWRDDDEIGFRILDRCPEMISEFEDAIYAAPSSRGNMKSVNDNIGNFRNHAMDDCKYLVNSDPRGGMRKKAIQWPALVKRWTK